MQNIKFEVSAIICFWVMLITDMETHTRKSTTKRAFFGLNKLQYMYIHQNRYFENFTPKQNYLYHIRVRKSKKVHYYFKQERRLSKKITNISLCMVTKYFNIYFHYKKKT